MGYVPSGVEELAEMVSAVEQFGLGVHSAGSNDAAAPFGSPEAENDTLSLEAPAIWSATMVLEPEAPGVTRMPLALNKA
jgi:hypothetical protein